MSLRDWRAEWEMKERYSTGNKFPGSEAKLLKVEGSPLNLFLLETFCMLRGKD